MTQSSFPYYNSGTETGLPVYESEWGDLVGAFVSGSGVNGNAGDTTLETFGDSSGRQVKVKAGSAIARGVYYKNTAEVTLAIAENTSGDPRIDYVVLEMDPDDDECLLAVVTGTPNPSPVPPSLTQGSTGIYQIPLAKVAVANGASTLAASDVDDARAFLQSRGVPTGTVVAWPTATAPAGWKLCDGQQLSRDAYNELFAVVGTSFGTGDGSTTFNVPNLKGKVPTGRDASQTEFAAIGQSGGYKTHTLTVAQMPAHNHTGTTSTNGNHSHTVEAEIGAQIGGSGATHFGKDLPSGSTIPAAGNHNHTFTTSTVGSTQSHPILQPYLTLNYIIKT